MQALRSCPFLQTLPHANQAVQATTTAIPAIGATTRQSVSPIRKLSQDKSVIRMPSVLLGNVTWGYVANRIVRRVKPAILFIGRKTAPMVSV